MTDTTEQQRRERTRRRRAKARQLREQGLSLAAIGDRLGVNKGTISRDLRAPVLLPPAGAAAEANTRNLQHGVWSEPRLRPVREQAVADAAQRWPWLDPIRLNLYADRLAKWTVALAYIDEHGLHRAKDGEPHPILRDQEKWAAQLERQIEQFDTEGRERQQQRTGFDAYVAELAQQDGDQNTEAKEGQA